MTEIPTMECPECRGTGRVDDLPDAYYPCPQCSGTGSIPRPPLTPDEIAALPDGARVVIEDTHPRCLRRGVVTSDADRDAALRLVRAGCRAWLAEEE